MSVWRDHNTYRYRVQRNGRVIAGAARTLAEAKELEAQALLDLHARRVGRSVERTLEQAIIRWMDSAEFRGLKSRANLESKIRQLVPYIENRALSDAPAVAETIKRDMLKRGHEKFGERRPYAAAAINRRLAILRHVCHLAYKEWEWLDAPIGQKIRLLRESNERHVYLTPEEARELIDACAHPEAKKAITIAVYTGLRAGEILQLRPRHIKGDCILLDPKTKNDRPRLIPILPEAREALDHLPVAIGYRWVLRQFAKARELITRPELHFHDLRHTMGAWLAQAGAQMVDIRDWLGHKNASTTSRYMHLNEQRLQDVAKRIKR